MGHSPHGMLAYGYDLGGGEAGWNIGNTQESGRLDLSWHFDEYDDFVEHAEKRLLERIAGFAETDWTAAGYRQRRDAAQDLVGVEFTAHGDIQEPSYALTAHVTIASWEHPEHLRPADLEQRRCTENWDERLATALNILELTPTQQHPAWLLMTSG
ncbi:hypothetical protein CFP71_09925 [Amycolatopsis thailandensis]|uniref:Uncharacterized protein n=1 Tax=Amycolatopsis thailandensis TaxID=589330 RepID=A0A229SEI7_9PSEU|nr:hypothetical protein [Amycolatopsis thailandensis]OXM57044.1 hypothetical protein CFP71_09925 [Amycolatopsis thailandensis]